MVGPISKCCPWTMHAFNGVLFYSRLCAELVVRNIYITSNIEISNHRKSDSSLSAWPHCRAWGLCYRPASAKVSLWSWKLPVERTLSWSSIFYQPQLQIFSSRYSTYIKRTPTIAESERHKNTNGHKNKKNSKHDGSWNQFERGGWKQNLPIFNIEILVNLNVHVLKACPFKGTFKGQESKSISKVSNAFPQLR